MQQGSHGTERRGFVVVLREHKRAGVAVTPEEMRAKALNASRSYAQHGTRAWSACIGTASQWRELADQLDAANGKVRERVG